MLQDQQRFSSIMCRHKHHVLLVLSLLILAVALREAPEIMSLTDDWSNDGTPVSVVRHSPRLTRRPASVGEKARRLAAESLLSLRIKEPLFTGRFLSSHCETGKSRLLVLSVRRV